MNKAEALKLFGGTVTATAKALGITHSAVSQWPDEGDIPESAENRVLAALARQHLSPEVLGQALAPIVEAPATEKPSASDEPRSNDHRSGSDRREQPLSPPQLRADDAPVDLRHEQRRKSDRAGREG